MFSERSLRRSLRPPNSEASSVFLPGCGSPKEEVCSTVCKHSCHEATSEMLQGTESSPPSDQKLPTRLPIPPGLRVLNNSQKS